MKKKEEEEGKRRVLYASPLLSLHVAWAHVFCFLEHESL
jgi:hypothetical protein